jgi:glycosyltransferase involved in cell wall biosynthesis
LIDKNKRYKILYVVKATGGGSTLSLYGLIKFLNKDRYIPIILFYFPNSYYQLFADLGLKIFLISDKPQKSNGIKIIGVKGFHRKFFIKLNNAIQRRILFLRNCIYQAFSIIKIIKKEGVDLVHFNNSLHHNLGGVFASTIFRIPKVIHVRGLRNLNFLDKIFGKFADFYIYISKAVKYCYCRQGIYKNENKVIYNPIELRKPTSGNIESTIRQEFRISKSEILISNIGRLDWWKGHDYFIEAISYVKEKEGNVKGIIVGPKINTDQCLDYYSKLQTMIKKLQLSKNIIFTGYRSDIQDIMNCSDIIIHSASEPEPFGRVIVEGMLAGKPVVATSAGGVLEIIEDGINGLLVPLKDSIAIASAILYLIKFPHHAQKIANRGTIFAKQMFNSKIHVDLVEDIYEKIIKS